MARPRAARVAYARHPSSGKRERLITVSTAKLDRAWQRDGSSYLPKRGEGKSEVRGRREGVQRFLTTGRPLQAPRISIGKDGGVSFVDGRHRFAVLRDSGVKRIAVMVRGNQLQAARRLFGGLSRKGRSLSMVRDG